VSVEHDQSWYARVRDLIEHNQYSHVEYHLHQTEPDYLSVAKIIPDGSLDFVLVDGLARAECALVSLGKLKPGGILILDNCNWYLPCASRSPDSVPLHGAPKSESWRRLHSKLSSWRCIWTTNGVTDTALWVKNANHTQDQG
jgi:predicted O-methyltransferase YrrM